MPKLAARALASGALAVALLLLTLRPGLRVPVNYLGDANVFLTRAKSIAEGHWVWHNPRIGMPFGADWRDYPLNITLDSAAMWVLSRFTSSPALIVNLEWLLAIAATAALAAYALMRLRFSGAVAIACGAIYALTPYTYFRGPMHLHCVYYAVPLVALAAIEIACGTRPAKYAWIGCVIAGLSYIYTAFFACFVLAAAALIALIARRQWRGFVFAAVVAVTAAADLSPSLLHWARDGRNASMLFKSPAEAQLYGLKLRYLVTPVPGHPLLGAVEQRLAPAKFPLFENESEWSRLGTVGTIGLLYLLGFALASIGGARKHADLVAPAAALTLCCVLFAASGGFSDFFSALVTPDIRCYTRIFPFIAFFAIVAAAVLLARLPKPALAAVAVLAAFDQAVYRDPHTDAWLADEAFVRRIETVLPRDAAVFELPYTDFPNEQRPGKFDGNDLLRPYLHSSKYRWSWGAVSGTTSAEWNRWAASLPTEQMLDAIVERGFQGLWVDTAGYANALPGEPLRSPRGRFLFYDLRGRKPGSAPVAMLFERGFYYEEREGDRRWRWSLRRGRMTLVAAGERAVPLSFRIEAADKGRHTVRIGDTQLQTPAEYRKTVDVRGVASIDIECDCPGVRAGDRVLYFVVTGYQPTSIS